MFAQKCCTLQLMDDGEQANVPLRTAHMCVKKVRLFFYERFELKRMERKWRNKLKPLKISLEFIISLE